MIFLLRFFKIHISKSTVHYNLNEGINNAVNFWKTRETLKLLTLFDFGKLISFDRSSNSNIRQKLQNLTSPLCTRTDEQVTVAASHFDAMKSLTKNLSGAVLKSKKKRKNARRTRRKKALKKMKKMSTSGECSQFPIASFDAVIVPEPVSNKESSSCETMAVSYRDVLANQNTSVLNAEEDTNMKELLKNARYEVFTPYGKWINEGWLDARATKGTRIKVLSYNILGQVLLEMHPYLYSNHDKRYLTWDYRGPMLIEEFTEFDADILCLQEVEASKLDFFDAALALQGYSRGIFKKRTGEQRDGCAIYYRTSKFELKEIVPVEYFQPGVSILNRDNVGLIVRLTPTDAPDKNIVVATTHLLFNPRRHDVRLAQIQLMLAEIERVAFKCTIQGRDTYHPIILTGDFNTRPFSPVYNLVKYGQVYLDYFHEMPEYLGITTHCQHYEVGRNRGPECRDEWDMKHVQLYNTERTIPPMKQYSQQELSWRRRDQVDYLSHRLSLNTVYQHNKDSKNDATTFHDTWCTVDYIFYGPVRYTYNEAVDGDMKLISYLRLPSYQEAENMKRIPNEVCASDHFPLLATFHLPTNT